MFISRTSGRTSGVTMLEIMIVVVIITILASLGFVMNFDSELDKFARLNLWRIYQSERDVFAFSAPNEHYESDFSRLMCGDPNKKDRHFRYQIVLDENAKGFVAKAISRKKASRFFTIDHFGNLTGYNGKQYSEKSAM
jgi:prepilin-type N-terminal cleavage/methylation domain-containing protein